MSQEGGVKCKQITLIFQQVLLGLDSIPFLAQGLSEK